MTKRDQIKAKIDGVEEQHLDALYQIIEAFETSTALFLTQPRVRIDFSPRQPAQGWQAFIAETYGSLADSPIERGEQA